MTTIYRLETLSSNQYDYITRYVGGLAGARLAAVRDQLGSLRLRSMQEVNALPGELVSPRGALELISSAETAGLAWDVSRRTGPWPDGPWVDLWVYPHGDEPTTETLLKIAWSQGKPKARKREGLVSLAEARRRLAAEQYAT